MSERIYSAEIDTGNDISGDNYPVIHVNGDVAFISFELRRGDDNVYVHDYYGRKYDDPWYKYFDSAFKALAWFAEIEGVEEFAIRSDCYELQIVYGEDEDGKYITVSNGQKQFWSVEDAIVWLFLEEWG